VLVQGRQFFPAGKTVPGLSSRDPAIFTSWANGTGWGAWRGRRELAVADPAADQQPVRALTLGDRGVGGLD